MIVVNGRFTTQPLTGVQRFARGITRELLRMRDDVVIVVPPGASPTAEYEGLPFIHVGNQNGHLWEQIDLPAHLFKMGRPVLLNLCSTAPIRYRRQIVTHHDITYARYPASFPLRFRLLYRSLVPQFLRHSEAIITVSEFSKQEIASHYRIDQQRFTVVPNAVDPIFSRSAVSSYSGNPYFLAVSSPSAHKNFGRLIEAYDMLAKPRPDLVIVGSSAAALVSPILGNVEGVRFTGRVTDRELVELYRGARAFVFPSLYEGFGIPPIEAQSCGCPVIASNAASMPEVLGESVRYVDPTDVQAIASEMAKLGQDDDLRTSLIEAGVDNAARYSWKSSALQVSHLIERLIAG